MTKRIYISSDYAENDGDRDVVNEIMRFCNYSRYSLNFVDMASVVSGSVSKNNPDCRACDLKSEFNSQINASSTIVFIVGDKTGSRTAGSNCNRAGQTTSWQITCTPYKQNTNGTKMCKVGSTCSAGDDVGNINSYSYLRHEFEQAVKRNKKIVIFYNAKYKMESWLPSYMSAYAGNAHAFWTTDVLENKVGNYELLKQELM